MDPNPTWQIVDVHCDEPEDIVGAGNHSPDWNITGDDTVELRAERSGTGDGRVYHILILATDENGNEATAEVAVTVAHDQGKKK